MYIVGKTGMGKTQLLENMVMSDILAGHGVCYIDPHGDTAEKILDFIPSNRINDVVYFNPADMEFPVGFNILETVDEGKKHLVRDGLMGVFKKIWPDVWSPRMEYILQNCIQALLDYPGATLLGINRLLVDREYRQRVIAKIRDPIVKTFWVAEFTSWSEKYATEAIAPVQNKVGQFLSASIIRNIVAQVKSTIDLRDIMDNGKILIVNLSKGRIGEDNMRLLGGMLITKLQLAAMERVDIPEDDRRDFYLYVDEFQNFATESFANILSEARKYHLNLIVAHQYIKQLEEEVCWAVFGNVGTIATFRVGSDDAAFMENEFLPVYTPEDLVNLAKYQVYLKLMVDGAATQPFSASTLPRIAKHTGNNDKVIAVSRERYAEHRALIEEKVLRWSGMEVATSSELDYPEILTDEEKLEKQTKSEEQIKPAESINEEDNWVQGDKEYLRISPERMASITKSQEGKKKDKPKFPHTCSRCGKIWEMPIKLDTTRPMFCAECLPLVREERKTKSSFIKTAFVPATKNLKDEEILIEEVAPTNKEENILRKTFEEAVVERPSMNSEPTAHTNRPRIIQNAPDRERQKSSIKITHGESAEEDNFSLLEEIQRSKGVPLEKNKAILTHDETGRIESVSSGAGHEKITDGQRKRKRKPKPANRDFKPPLRTSSALAQRPERRIRPDDVNALKTIFKSSPAFQKPESIKEKPEIVIMPDNENIDSLDFDNDHPAKEDQTGSALKPGQKIIF